MNHLIHDACPICGGRGLHSLSGYERAHLTQCATCGLTFSRRIPSDTELAEHYDDYGHGWIDSSLTRTRYRELLASFENYRSTNRLFDIGCGAGYFLEEARLAGWEVYGNEFSRYAIQLARGRQLEVIHGAVPEDAFPPGDFDVITAFEVFEHVRDPNEQSQLVARLLRPGGLLYCTTPNFNALSRRILGARWNVIEYPEHLIYFTPRTMDGWLTQSGFATSSMTTSGVSPARIRAAIPRGNRVNQSCSDEGLRQATEGSRILGFGKRAINGALAAAGAGDTLKARFTRLDR